MSKTNVSAGIDLAIAVRLAPALATESPTQTNLMKNRDYRRKMSIFVCEVPQTRTIIINLRNGSNQDQH